MYEEHFENVESPEDLEPAAQQFLDEINVEKLLDRLEGRDGRLRPSKPQAQSDDDLVRYVWRIARFHSGDDPSMPVMADTDLNYWLQNESENNYSMIERDSRIGSGKMIDKKSKGYKQIVGISHTIAKVIVLQLNGDPDGGIKRWKKAIYG